MTDEVISDERFTAALANLPQVAGV
jgi:hypothetical protein